jgi:hypothetical protein
VFRLGAEEGAGCVPESLTGVAERWRRSPFIAPTQPRDTAAAAWAESERSIDEVFDFRCL